MNLYPDSMLRIYTLSGEFVVELDAMGAGEVQWDCRNRYKYRLSPGIYYIVIFSEGREGFYRNKLFITGQ